MLDYVFDVQKKVRTAKYLFDLADSHVQKI